MYITELIYPRTNEGDKDIECAVCGYKGKGYDFAFSDNYVGWSFLKKGNGLCSSCYRFLGNQDLRKRHFIATLGQVRFLEKKDLRDVLLNLPEPPFFIYITESHKKQGWMGHLDRASMSKNHFYISTDFIEGVVYTSLKEVQELFELYDRAAAFGMNKTEMKTGRFKVSTYQKAELQGQRRLLQEVKNKSYMPIWEVIVYVG